MLTLLRLSFKDKTAFFFLEHRENAARLESNQAETCEFFVFVLFVGKMCERWWDFCDNSCRLDVNYLHI